MEQLIHLAAVVVMMDSRPGIEDAQRLPAMPYLQDCVKLNCDYRDELASRSRIMPDDAQTTAAILEAEYVNQWLTLAVSVRDPRNNWSESDRRDLLQQIRQLMGAEAYYAGQWPAAVPWWRLRRHP